MTMDIVDRIINDRSPYYIAVLAMEAAKLIEERTGVIPGDPSKPASDALDYILNCIKNNKRDELYAIVLRLKDSLTGSKSHHSVKQPKRVDLFAANDIIDFSEVDAFNSPKHDESKVGDISKNDSEDSCDLYEDDIAQEDEK